MNSEALKKYEDDYKIIREENKEHEKSKKWIKILIITSESSFFHRHVGFGC